MYEQMLDGVNVMFNNKVKLFNFRSGGSRKYY